MTTTSLATGSGALVRFESVGLAAGDVVILDGVSCAIAPGRPTVLLGPNGSGKSTLLKLTMGLLQPTSGEIHSELAAGDCAFVLQKPVMLRRSAAANVAFALTAAGRPADVATIQEALELVGLDHLANRPARRLSGGEQQRLALARALVRKPKLLLLDEPTASLDPAATQAVEDIVARVTAAGVTVVMATHDLGQARRLAGTVILMIAGRAMECAPAEAFFENPSSEAARRFLAGEIIL